MLGVMQTRRAFFRSGGLIFAGWLTAGPRVFGTGARIHKVVRGDTLSEIAARHGVSVAALKSRNGLKSDRIFVGQTLFLPDPGAVAAVPAGVLDEVKEVTRHLHIRPGRWRYIVIHHSGIEDGNAKAYDRAHRERGMENGLAYDFVIGNGRDSGDGEIEIGPRWRKQLQGGHVRSAYYNEHGIGICLVGNFEKRRPGKTQMASLIALVDWLRDEAPLGCTPKVTVHRWVDKNHTVCPGRYFPFDELKRLWP